ncbi:MAG: universal stress protein [Aeromicrobium sp.]|nr:universal stress protein [Burkholderiales bacterium]
MFKSILVPVDGSKLSLKALIYASKLASTSGARLTVMTALPEFPTMIGGEGYMVAPFSTKHWDDMIQKRADAIKARTTKQLKDAPYEFTSVTSDHPHDAIISVAKKRKCDLIVMASHGRRGLSALLLGSETTKVLTHSTVPVLVCR